MDKLEKVWNALQSMVFENLLANSFSSSFLLFLTVDTVLGRYNICLTKKCDFAIH